VQGELTTVTNDAGEIEAPTKHKDILVFIELVELTRQLLPRIDAAFIAPWITELAEHALFLARQHHRISATFKLVALVFTLCEKRSFLEESSTVMDKSNKARLISVMSDFIVETLAKLPFLQDELLSATLQMLLECPTVLVRMHAEGLVSSVMSGVVMGQSHMPLAVQAVDAVHKWWSIAMPELSSAPQMRDVVCALNSFIAVDMAAINADVLSATEVGLTELRMQEQLRLNILRFLGEIGGVSSWLVERDARDLSKDNDQLLDTDRADGDQMTRQAISVSVALPFQDCKLEVRIGQLMPRVVTLSVSGGDKRVKMAACEMLHAVALYLVGRLATSPPGTITHLPMS
jgi:DNA-dependent protein kinase catalytic subunit